MISQLSPRVRREQDLAVITAALWSKPFVPHRLFRNAHAQTLLGYFHPRRFNLRFFAAGEARLFAVAPNVQIKAYCHWQTGYLRRANPILVLVHGLEGSSDSVYILSVASNAFKAGFNVLRLNLRTCGGTEHLTTTLYHSGMSGDLRAVINELIELDKLTQIFIAGFSLGGNLSLKLIGEWGANVPPQLRGVAAVSPSIDLAACAAAIEQPANRIYNNRFITSLKKKMRRLQKLYPALYDLKQLASVRTVRDFDRHYTAIYNGFNDVEDYYAQSSALQFIEQIRLPTLVIQAQDDPFVPFDAFRSDAFKNNPLVTLLAPEKGGHVGFISAQKGKNRFWAENRLLEFFRLLADNKN